MTRQQEYHNSVNRWISASVAVFGVLFLPFVLSPASHAQMNSAGGSGGHSASGGHGPATAMSVAPPTANRVAPPTSGTSFHSNLTRTGPNHDHDRDHGHRRYYYPYGGVYAVPVPYGADATSGNDVSDDANYQGGPTIFDRRGSGPQNYIPPTPDAAPVHANYQSAMPDPPAEGEEQPEELTTLIFKDGHQMEVGNYAIVGHTLYDMSPGHPHKVALADLDLDAAEKQNGARGVAFRLPPSAQAN